MGQAETATTKLHAAEDKTLPLAEQKLRMDHIRERLGILEKSIDIAGAYADKSTAFTRDGIGEIAAVDAGNLEIHILHLAPEEAAVLLIGGRRSFCRRRSR